MQSDLEIDIFSYKVKSQNSQYQPWLISPDSSTLPSSLTFPPSLGSKLNLKTTISHSEPKHLHNGASKKLSLAWSEISRKILNRKTLEKNWASLNLNKKRKSFRSFCSFLSSCTWSATGLILTIESSSTFSCSFQPNSSLPSVILF